MNRKLATIRAISAIKSHDNAEKLEIAVVDGWQCVVKKGEFQAGDAVCYFEIDSWMPTSVAPFLTKPEKEPKEFNGVKGERLRTMRLRGELSQGLVLPLTVLPTDTLTLLKLKEKYVAHIGEDVTEILNIEKYEKPLPACLVGMAKGVFPSFIRKTDQERIQNVFHTLTPDQIEDIYEVTLKVDGSSATYYVKDGETGVCSRNLELKLEGNEDNSFVKMFNQLGLHEKLLDYHKRTGRNIALQGELWGSGINGNHEGINDHRYNVFDVYDIDQQGYMNWADRGNVCEQLGIIQVPFIEFNNLKGFSSVNDFLNHAERESIFNKVAEGIVFKSTTKPDFSFKAISNQYLLQKGE